MTRPGPGAEQARLLGTAINRAGLRLEQVWMHYFSVGGNAGEVEVEAFLHHALPLPTLERDMLAHAVNELIDQRHVARAPYSYDLVDPSEGRAGTSDRGPDEEGGP